ncbi:MAG TPA: hypothetical protein VFK52_03040 [Nocardioidaceae bacterium]|nr:hypothetical protein [Nocardioidaceae bacterium]
MPSRPAVVRFTLSVALLAGGALTLLPGSSTAQTEPTLAAVARADCGRGSRPETDIQGRVPRRDYESGRVKQGYTCNTRLVGRQGNSGGFKTFRYVDPAGHVCAFYDSTLLILKDLIYDGVGEGRGVRVLDISDPRNPRRTTSLTTLPMLNPHESLVFNARRGLLAATLGTPATAPAVVAIYDVKTDCRYPKLLSMTVQPALGHEAGFAPDGRTLYVTGAAGTFVALDVADPRRPRQLFAQYDVVYHGIRVSPDGRTAYVANIGYPNAQSLLGSGGLRILDVSEIQDRKPQPRVRVLSDLSWRSKSIPQHADPIVVNGHKYVLEMDEYASFKVDLDFLLGAGFDADAAVGGARLINVDDPRAPFLVSNLRLEVNNPEGRIASAKDPGASLPVQGYTGHYCSAPKRVNPKLVACSFVASGLRVFNIENPRRPREVAYFNVPKPPNPDPMRQGAWAMSAPAWDLKNRLVYYTDANSGFYAVRLTNGVVPRSYLR